MKHKIFYKFDQLKRHVKQLNKLIKTGRFKTLSIKKRKQIINRIERLQRQLTFTSGTKQVKRLLAAASLALGLAITPAAAQNFITPQTNPFGLTGSYLYSFATSKDLDDDGDFDVLIGQYGSFGYYQNTGSATAPVFGSLQTNPFGLTDTSTYITSFPELADIDGDGDYDLFMNTVYNPAIQYFENIGTATAPAFAAPVNNPFGITTGTSYAIPTFADMDDDGDLDLLYAGYYGALSYLENTGTATAPAFAAPTSSPFGITGLPYTFTVFPKLADIDGDCDYDLAYGYGGYGTYVHMNTGTKAAPVFGAPTLDPFGLAGASSYLSFATPLFMDWDGDGDADVLQGGSAYPSGFIYQENNVAPVSADTSITTIKNTDYTFALGDFPFIDDSPNLVSVTIESLPFNGQLRNAGAPVSAGDVIMAADIGNFTFTPWPDSIGLPYTTLEFSVADANTSSGIHVLTINVEAPVGVAQLIDNSKLIIAPNPTTNYLRVEVVGVEIQNPASLSVLDVSGKLVYSETIEPSELSNKTISTSDLANGVYFLVIETEQGVMRERFIKK